MRFFPLLGVKLTSDLILGRHFPGDWTSDMSGARPQAMKHSAGHKIQSSNHFPFFIATSACYIFFAAKNYNQSSTGMGLPSFHAFFWARPNREKKK